MRINQCSSVAKALRLCSVRLILQPPQNLVSKFDRVCSTSTIPHNSLGFWAHFPIFSSRSSLIEFVTVRSSSITRPVVRTVSGPRTGLRPKVSFDFLNFVTFRILLFKNLFFRSAVIDSLHCFVSKFEWVRATSTFPRNSLGIWESVLLFKFTRVRASSHQFDWVWSASVVRTVSGPRTGLRPNVSLPFWPYESGDIFPPDTSWFFYFRSSRNDSFGASPPPVRF